MTFILTLILLYLLWWLLRPYIWPRLQRWLIKRATRKVYEQFGGAPPEDDSRKSSRKNHKKHTRYGYSNEEDHIIPSEYAEDVEYTEIKSYSQATAIHDDAKGVSYETEEQVSDVEYEIIKEKKK